MTQSIKQISGLTELRHYFAHNKVPIYFISATNFNLLGIDEWVKHFRFINYIDCFDGRHTNIITPIHQSSRVLDSIEDINHYLLENKDIQDQFEQDQNRAGMSKKPRALFLFFNQETERICDSLGLECAFPAADLVHDIDNKITTTEIGNQANVPSVPNQLTRISSFSDLKTQCQNAKLGDSWVIQLPYGDSGKTTFFVENEDDYNQYSDQIESEETVKIMKRIQCKGTAIEACVTDSGTIVGPLMSELIGYPELTPYKGGWCGNALHQSDFSLAVRTEVQQNVIRLGNELQKRGYKGYFEVDFLIDTNTNDVYLGEINPRITGISAMTNLAEFATAMVPPFLFHIMAFSDVPYTIDVDQYNEYVLHHGATQTWGQLVFKYTTDDIQIVTDAPASGVWALNDGHMDLVSPHTHRRAAQQANQAFFYRITKTDDYVYKGADLGILFIQDGLMTSSGNLTDTANQWISALQKCYHYRALTTEEQLLVARYRNPGQLKVF